MYRGFVLHELTTYQDTRVVLVNNCRGCRDCWHHISDHSRAAVVRLLAIDRARCFQPVPGSSFPVVEWEDLMQPLRIVIHIKSRLRVIISPLIHDVHEHDPLMISLVPLKLQEALCSLVCKQV